MKKAISDGLDGKIRALAMQLMSRITPTDSELTSLTCGNYIFYLCALTLILFFTGLGERDLWAPVEPRYAEIARIMYANGEWVVPRINGDFYTDKPILYFWLVLIASKIAGGVNEWTVRLPSALAGIGFVLTTYLYRPRLLQLESRIDRGRGFGHFSACHMGSALGAHRHAVRILISLDNLLRGSFTLG